MNNIVELGCLISKLLSLVVNFLSAIVIIFYPVPPLPCEKMSPLDAVALKSAKLHHVFFSAMLCSAFFHY